MTIFLSCLNCTGPGLRDHQMLLLVRLAFAARASHSASLSSTALEASYNFMQRIILMFRSVVAQGKIDEMAPTLALLFQRINSTIMVVQLMSHDSAMTARELFTHLYMLRRRTVLDTAGVDLPQRDKDKLMVMSIGDNDLFGPDAHMVT